MDFKQLLASLDSMSEDAILNKPHSSKRFDDQVSGTDQARHISVLGNPAGDPKHPFQGKLVGGCAEADQHLDEDLIQQLTQEYADFLRAKPVADKAKPSKLLTRAQLNDTPEKRKQQGRCVSCGQSLSTAGRGTGDRCKECSN